MKIAQNYQVGFISFMQGGFIKRKSSNIIHINLRRKNNHDYLKMQEKSVGEVQNHFMMKIPSKLKIKENFLDLVKFINPYILELYCKKIYK